ncbi:hypothetical protein [Mycoplasmopsis cricetuli]|uniref:hypothetical protein n=1 Tax=Mycoplasmopsis cricetuli TaxID=171283 RepID=UPI000471ACD0|nr:hypothetical protein [Mycoplasmopsis cricetuli]
MCKLFKKLTTNIKKFNKQNIATEEFKEKDFFLTEIENDTEITKELQTYNKDNEQQSVDIALKIISKITPFTEQNKQKIFKKQRSSYILAIIAILLVLLVLIVLIISIVLFLIYKNK